MTEKKAGVNPIELNTEQSIRLAWVQTQNNAFRRRMYTEKENNSKELW